MSRLAHAGDSSTASPCLARRRPGRRLLQRPHVEAARRSAQGGLQRRRVAADQQHGARVARAGAASGAKSWPLPSPPGIRRSGGRFRRRLAQPVQRGDGRADVGALAVVEELDLVDAAIGSTRCGSPRYSRRPCSIGASGRPTARRAPAPPARWRRCGGRGCAARRPASGAGCQLDRLFRLDRRAPRRRFSSGSSAGLALASHSTPRSFTRPKLPAHRLAEAEGRRRRVRTASCDDAPRRRGSARAPSPAEDARLGGRVRGHAPCQSRWSCVTLSTVAASGSADVVRAGSWTARAPRRAAVVRSSFCSTRAARPARPGRCCRPRDVVGPRGGTAGRSGW